MSTNNLSNFATVTLLVKKADIAPVATNDSFSGNENATLIVTPALGMLANDTDADGDVLSVSTITFSGVPGATVGTQFTNPATGNKFTVNSNGSIVMVPATNFFGTESFTYKANDSQLDSNTATVTITINHVNQPPVANND